jgi:hypothetical protein
MILTARNAVLEQAELGNSRVGGLHIHKGSARGPVAAVVSSVV